MTATELDFYMPALQAAPVLLSPVTIPHECILVVDDDSDIRELLAFQLEIEGFTAFTAESGLDALETARALTPDLIILDIVMPGITGLEVCRDLRADQFLCGLPIILLTANAANEQIGEGLEAGADAYLTKPFGARFLFGEIRRLLNSGPS